MKYKRVFIFIAITYLMSWLLALIFYLMGGKMNTNAAAIVASVYMLMPMIAAIIVQKIIYHQEIIIPFGIYFKINKFWFLAWLLPLALVAGVFAGGFLIPGVQFTSDFSGVLERYKDILPPEQLEQTKQRLAEISYSPYLIVAAQAGMGFLAGISVNAVMAFGEELGWRGFLFQEFRELNFWNSSLLTGFVWGLWHFPLILLGQNYPHYPQVGVLLMILFCILLAPIFTYIRIKSKSVIPAAIFHGTINGTAGLPIIMIKGGSDLTVGLTGLVGFIVLFFINIILFLVLKSRQGEP